MTAPVKHWRTLLGLLAEARHYRILLENKNCLQPWERERLDVLYDQEGALLWVLGQLDEARLRAGTIALTPERL